MVYTGKSVIIGKDAQGKAFVAYRITSRSQSNRKLVADEKKSKNGEGVPRGV
jgi:IMP cyclohydrolase